MWRAIIAILFPVIFLATAAGDDERIEVILSDAGSKRSDAIAKADADYRAAVASTFRFADRIDVFLLDFSMGADGKYKPKEEDESFSIRPYKATTKILKSLKVPAKSIPVWCAAMAKALATDDGGSLCHYPIHGLRIYAGDELLLETSICWECNNCYFTYDGESQWLGIEKDSGDLKKLLNDFMPIPEAELQRFKSKYAK
jgi:hypothetical protein